MARLSAVSQRRPGQAPEPVRALVQCADEDGHEAGEKMNSRAKTRTAAVQYGSEKTSA